MVQITGRFEGLCKYKVALDRILVCDRLQNFILVLLERSIAKSSFGSVRATDGALVSALDRRIPIQLC
jgi:hypothetical protein